MSFDARPYLKELARGADSARPLSRELAREVFAAMFEDRVAPAALGAILVALRINGETVAEIAGMMDALAPHVRPMALPSGGARPLMLGSYNGARKLANLVPLLALRLAREGIPVIVHGTHQEPTRTGTFEILAALGHAPVASLDEAQARLAAGGPAPVPLALLSPALARMLDMRQQLGVRNSGHTLAKLLLPAGRGPAEVCRLISVTHPEFMQLMHDYLAAERAEALLMRGVEGEPVVRLHAPQPIEVFSADAGPRSHELEGEADYPLPARDAQATAQWTRDVLEGKVAAPVALEQQVRLVAARCRARHTDDAISRS